MMINTSPPAADVADDFAGWVDSQARRWGFAPNYADLFSSRPDVAAAWTTLNVAIRNGMDRRRFELATIAAARQRRSTYCAVAHSLMLRDDCNDEPALRALVLDPWSDALDATDRAVVAFARKVADAPSDISATDIDALRAVGLTDDEVADVIFAVAARCFFATAVDAAGIRTDRRMADDLDAELVAALVTGRSVDERATPGGSGATCPD